MRVLSYPLLLASFLLFVALPVQSFACPKVLRLLDTNCDSKIRMMITGDSIVSGIGDPRDVGYPGRLETLVGNEDFKALNVGIPGITPTRLMRAFIRNIDRGRETTRKTTDIDYAMIQVGTNSYWDKEEPFQVTMKIYRLKKYLERALLERNGTKPVTFVATVPLTQRDYQNPFLRSLNANLARKKGLNLYVHFDRIPVSQLGIKDTLHPGPKGYTKMARIVRHALYTSAQRKAKKAFKDKDNDGLYDAVEIGRSFTDPLKADSDDDGLSDSEEVLIYKTNPNLVDTDNDSLTDREEVLGGTNPLVAEEL